MDNQPNQTNQFNQYQQPKSNPIARFFSSAKTGFKDVAPKKRLAIVSGISLGVLVFGVAILQFYGPKAPEPDPIPDIVAKEETPPPEPTPVVYYSELTGMPVEAALNERHITGVMIENSIDARPQSGLTDAGVVFEAIAEGGITRFLALFQEAQPDYVGPIRSARPYYVRWAAGFNAGYAHSGGSGEALALIPALGVRDLDHGRYSKSFDRVSNRFAPHNVYTSIARLDALYTQLGYSDAQFEGFARLTPEESTQAKADSAAEKANTLTFNISGANYNTSYTYNPTNGLYARVMAGQPHTDERSGLQITPAVVIALEVGYGIHADGVHSVYNNVGSGVATVFQNGQVLHGTWTKESDTAPLKFTDGSGQPLKLQAGQTWITAIQAGRYSYAQ